ncbi:hypothetical protein F8M41_018552 [Gigaspora margarita]|uniref:Uncharacterized protein n=1 Tax=Gigaspora margarita TaxID=4874 RepID=A0A8H4ELC5_GIGMA|nr:hypothetical protein F8M41_018552 [Gigaspora margarita]
MPERSLYKNGDSIVSVVEERFLYDDSRVEKELGKNRIEMRKVDEKLKVIWKHKSDLDLVIKRKVEHRRRINRIVQLDLED